MHATDTGIDLEEIVENLDVAVIRLDGELRVQWLNPSAQILFGVSSAHARGVHVATALPYLKPQIQHIRMAIETGQPFTEREMPLERQGGESITVDCTVTPIPQGRVGGLLLEIHRIDRHLRISRDEQLWQQQEISREMIRGLAHEVKNPLGGLRGAAQLLARELPSAELTEYTDIIIGEADRLQNLVDKLLGPNQMPRRDLINVHEVIEHVARVSQAHAPEVGITRDYDPSLPELIGDREQLIQTLLNVVVNALEAMSQRGNLVLRTRVQRHLTIGGQRHRLVAQIDIVDDGPGIEPQLRETLFYPMVSSRPDGSGLGLAIAQNLIHNHGGLIECHSRPGETVFSIYLPVEGQP